MPFMPWVDFVQFGEQTLGISPEGASILLWRVGGNTILGPEREVLIGQELKKRGRSHWCFPNHGQVLGSVPRNQTPWSGWPQHGFMRDQPMAQAKVDENSVEYEQLIEARGPRRWFFQVKVLYTLGSRSEPEVVHWLSAWLHIKNVSSAGAKAPILPALLPYFNCQGQDSSGVTVRTGTTSRPFLKGAVGPLSLDLVDPVVIDLGFGCVQMRTTKECRSLVVWSDQAESYICVEPIFFGQPGTFGQDGQQRYLDPGEMVSCKVDMEFYPGRSIDEFE